MKIAFLLGLLTAVSSQNTTRDKFKYLDINGDGNLRPADMQIFFKKFDTNDDGILDFPEFSFALSYSTQQNPTLVTEIEQKATFNVYDKLDGKDDGKISSSIATSFIKILDENKNNEVLFREFRKTFKKIMDAITEETIALEKQ